MAFNGHPSTDRHLTGLMQKQASAKVDLSTFGSSVPVITCISWFIDGDIDVLALLICLTHVEFIHTHMKHRCTRRYEIFLLCMYISMHQIKYEQAYSNQPSEYK